MGTRWDFATIPSGRDASTRFATHFQSVISHLDRPVDISLIVSEIPAHITTEYSLVNLVEFINRDVIMGDLPSDMAALPLFHNAPRFADKAINDLRKTSIIFLAQQASILFQRSTAFLYSDTLCSTGFVHFSNGALDEGEIYGEGGTETLIRVAGGHVEFTELPFDPENGFEYWSAWEHGANQFLNWPNGVEELGQALEALPSYRLRLMKKRELIVPVELEEEA